MALGVTSRVTPGVTSGVTLGVTFTFPLDLSYRGASVMVRGRKQRDHAPAFVGGVQAIQSANRHVPAGRLIRGPAMSALVLRSAIGAGAAPEGSGRSGR